MVFAWAWCSFQKSAPNNFFPWFHTILFLIFFQQASRRWISRRIALWRWLGVRVWASFGRNPTPCNEVWTFSSSVFSWGFFSSLCLVFFSVLHLPFFFLWFVTWIVATLFMLCTVRISISLNSSAMIFLLGGRVSFSQSVRVGLITDGFKNEPLVCFFTLRLGSTRVASRVSARWCLIHNDGNRHCWAVQIWEFGLYEEMPRIIVKAIFAPNYCHFCFTNNFGISQPIPARVVSID